MGKSDGRHVKVTARHKIARIEKEIQKLEPLASAQKAVEQLRKRLEYWKNLLK
jgi:hypothetical protein